MTESVDLNDPGPAFFDLVGNVRAMRRLKPDPIPDELLWKVLNAGVQAPSGQNTQPWKFVLVRSSRNMVDFCANLDHWGI